MFDADNLKDHTDFTQLCNRLMSKPFKCVCIFADNSGFDVILGVLPLIVELLKSSERTKVILCSNTSAAINDITHGELLLLIKKACSLNATLNECMNTRLMLIDSGSTSPCLDMSRINKDLADLVANSQLDLIILEGMGRAVHTNLDAKFACSSLKAAVLKNKWLADRLADKCCVHNCVDKFPFIFKYEEN